MADERDDAQELSWQGEQGRWWADNAGRTEAMLSVFTPHLFAAAAIEPGEAVLDVGCGGGLTSIGAAGLSSPGPVLGVDASDAVVELARRRAVEAGVANVEFVVADAGAHPLAPGSFDVVISRFGVMFFVEPVAAFANLARAIKPGGRLAFLCWQAMELNEHAALPLLVAARYVPLPERPGGPGPWSMADPATIRDVLSRAGFAEPQVAALQEELRAGNDIDDTVEFYLSQPMARSCMAAAAPGLVSQVTGAIRAELASHAGSDGVMLGSAAWLVTARKPGQGPGARGRAQAG
ncbi:MAG: class I SAM-dependent methyltransferase [Acidimicrobiales bacterium]